MAKKSIVTDVFAWVPPPVTKEEALNPYTPGSWQRDGFDGKGGGEPPSEYQLDQIVYPHDQGPIEAAQNRESAKREADAEKFRDEALQRSRNFDISEDNFTGENPGSPSSYKKGD